MIPARGINSQLALCFIRDIKMICEGGNGVFARQVK